MITKNIHRTSFSRVFRLLFLVLGINTAVNLHAQITYTKQDSLKVLKLLQEGQKSSARGSDLMLFYGHKLKGTPYVAHTLEVNSTEQLVVNMRQMDCTTFVETVLALARTTVQGSISWDDFCNNLRLIRYDNGKIDGYPSRNHYFFWWVESNKKLNVVTTPQLDAKISKTQKIYLDWMTTHSSSYSMLRGNSQFINEIKEHERLSSEQTMQYIPKETLNLSLQLQFIQNGDILAICTNKKGLDTTHIGIAEWGSDGQLHMLNASQIHKKVILEQMSLYQYMQQHPVQIGVWVIRPKL